MLDIGDTVLIVIDVQGKLASVMFEKDALFENLRRAIAGTKSLGLPVLWVEQNPSRMGATSPEVAEMLAGLSPIPKMAFSCCGEPRFVKALEASGRRQVLLCGIESHVCVCQTALDLHDRSYEVHVLSDAVSSRTQRNREIGLERMRQAGVTLSGVEMALFELMRTAEHAAFRDVLRIVR
jgi:nicotinamidase-related amidase